MKTITSKLSFLQTQISQDELLTYLLQIAHHQKLPLAIWKLPQSKLIRLVIDFGDSFEQVKTDLEELGSGFVISPFINNGSESWFIQADLFWEGSLEETQAPYFAFSHRSQQYLSPAFLKKQSFEEALSRLIIEKNKHKILLNAIKDSYVISESDFEQSVRQAVQEIAHGTFRKVVLSRNKQVALPNDFDLIATFKKLCHLHSHALVSIISSSYTGTWIGATPEILVSVDTRKVFRTMALAGTQPKGAITNLSEAMWTQKEIEEQALVSRYIINCLKKIRVREFEEVGPKTVASGNLLHLRTDFEIDMTEINFPQLGTVMLELLHPTSAVCGMPKDNALQFILNNEKYNRELYSGYLGEVNIAGASNLFVNLRCMQVFDRKAILYAGAGITQDSNAEKEWKETEMKMEAMRQVIGR